MGLNDLKPFGIRAAMLKINFIVLDLWKQSFFFFNEIHKH